MVLRRVFWAAALLAMAGPKSGWAQTTAAPLPLLRSPLTSVTQAGSGVADGAEPWAVVLNPASLGDLQSWTLGLRDTETGYGADNYFFGRGTGIYYAQPLPLVRRLKLGAGLEILRPPDDSATTGKLTLSLSYHLFSALSLGLSYAHLFENPAASGYNGLDTVGVGARLRLGRYLAAGLVLHDLSAPRPSDPALGAVQRSFEGEVLIRPLGDERFELAATGRGSEQSQEAFWRLRLWVRPTRGFALGGEGALLTHAGSNAPVGYWFGFGTQVDFAQVGFSAFGWGGNRPATPKSLDWLGGSVALRFSGQRYPAVWSGYKQLYRIELGQKSGETLLRLLTTLQRIEYDARAQGVLVVVSGVSGSWGVADELREALLRLRAAGKHVYVYAADLNTREYYIASAAEHIFLDPIGSVRLQGVQLGGFFLKNTLDRVGIRADLVRIGDFKSSPEMWTRGEPTAPALAQRQLVVEDLASRLRDSVGKSRRLAPATVEELFEQSQFMPEAARAAHLIDSVASSDQVEAQLTTLLGGPFRLGVPSAPSRPRSWEPPTVAVIHVDGDLADGKSRKIPFLELKTVGGETLSQALAEVERDAQIKAVVIRVDSPGGSALWADLLARQVGELARVKPVVCSFGDIAASGGYYLAAMCGEIFTNPSTITGSIGIYGGKVDISGLLELVSAKRVSVQHGAHADMDGPYRPYTEAERALVRERLQHGYDRFVATVAIGRHMSFGEVDAIARGRVWTGAQAQRLKLCDKTGGLVDAIAAARARAGLPSKTGYREEELQFYPRAQPGLLDKLLGLAPELLTRGAEVSAELPGLAPVLRGLAGLIAPLGDAFLLSSDPVLMRLDGDLGELAP